MRRALLVVCLASAASACARRASFDAALADDGTFPAGQLSPDEARRFRAAADYSRENGGLSLLALRGTEVVFEEQHNANAEGTPHHLFSGTKTFSCALAVALAQEQVLDLDRPVAEVVTEWQSHPLKARITARHLLSFTSGLDEDRLALTIDGLRERQRVEDKYALALGLGALQEPGTYYRYGSAHLMAFGAYVKRLTGRDPLDLLQEKVLGPIGFRHGGWIKDPAGNAALPYGAWTTAREWAKFGVLLRDGGRWKGRQVLDSGRLAECFRGSDPMPGYGLAVWLNASVPADKLNGADLPIRQTDGENGPLLSAEAPADLFAAAGYNDQRLYVFPSSNLIVVRLGNGDGDFRDPDFLRALLK